MYMRVAKYVACLAILGLLGVPGVRAEEEGSKEHEHDWTAKWSNGHKLEKDDKAFSMKWGGRIQADYIFASQNSAVDEALGEDAFQNGFEFRRARLFMEGTIYERIKFKAQYDFAGGDADFKDVWIAIKGGKGDLKFGHFKEFMSINEITSSKYLAFNERALPVEFFSPSRNSGVGYTARSGAITWGLGYFYDADDFGVSLNEDRTNLTGRFVYRPIESDDGKSLLHLGVAFTAKQIEDGGTLRFRGRPGNHFGPRPVDTRGIPADDALVLQAEIAGVAGRFWYAGEYYDVDVNSPSTVVAPLPEEEFVAVDPSLDGWYVQGGFYLTDDYRRYKASSGGWDRQKPSSPWLKDGGKGAWEIGLRYAEVDLSEARGPDAYGRMSNFTLNVNWYLNPATRLMLGYVATDIEGDGVETGTIDSVLIRWQVDF